jgi:Flp pilus assembly protein TadD
MTTFIRNNTALGALTTTAAAVLIGTFSPLAAQADGWELTTVDEEVPGTRKIESGQIQEGIRLSEESLKWPGHDQRVAELSNLCIGYILSNQLDKAEPYCNRALENSSPESAHSVVSRNNLGVLQAIRGDYGSAQVNFKSAWDTGCRRRCENAEVTKLNDTHHVALRNLQRMESQQLAGRDLAGADQSIGTND